jgi:prepilin-type processing-associated H-X9-DG protein
VIKPQVKAVTALQAAALDIQSSFRNVAFADGRARAVVCFVGESDGADELVERRRDA